MPRRSDPANASHYSIDPRGLTAMADEAIETAYSGSAAITADPDAPAGATQGRLGIGTSSLRSELQLSQDSLRTLADETNGFAAVNSNDFSSAFERIVSTNSAYYVLAYNPPARRRDGKFHRIDVRCRDWSDGASARGYVDHEQKATSRIKNRCAALRGRSQPPPAGDGLKMGFRGAVQGVKTSGSGVVGGVRGSEFAARGQRVELA